MFTNLMAHADREGFADIHPRAIAEEVGLTVDEVKTALAMLESPDDESRSPEEQGRRIVRMDEHRAWGWKLVNYMKYRGIRDEDDRREQNRIAQANWRSKQADNKQSKPASATVSECSSESAHTEAEAEAVKAIAQQAARFPEFWKAYPVKKGKAKAEARWKSRGLDAIADKIIADVKRRVAVDRQWQDRKFIPHGSTYVSSRGWEDDVETEQATTQNSDDDWMKTAL